MTLNYWLTRLGLGKRTLPQMQATMLQMYMWRVYTPSTCEEAREFFDKQGEPVHYDYDSLDELAKALGFNSWDEACSE